jgi:2'-5' RNA ligase
MTTPWRCFVSVPIGDDLRAALADALEGWKARSDLSKLRWSDPAGWHLTLAFIGDTEPGAVERLTERLTAAASGHRRFELPTGGLGGFPSDARARVAWYGVADPDGRLERLAADVGRAVDLEPDRPFTAHLTVARATPDRTDLRAWVTEADAPAGVLPVNRVDLMRSHPRNGPARYELLASAPLGGAAR